MDVKIVRYTPEWHNRLFDYMVQTFPNRSKDYLDWWITWMDRTIETDFSHLFLYGDMIVGCFTTQSQIRARRKGEELFFSWRCNTIISPSCRGKGIGGILYNTANQTDHLLYGTGATDLAWKILPKKLEVFRKLAAVKVLITFNRFVVCSMLQRMGVGSRKKSEIFPDTVTLGRKEELRLCSDVTQIVYPEDGYWMGDENEIVRDQETMYHRFVDIWRSANYKIYAYYKEEKQVGYLVVRKTCYAGIDMLSLVDFRFKGISFKRIQRAVNKLAVFNRWGMVMTLTNYPQPQFSFFPLTIKMKKNLWSFCSDPKMNDGDYLLITSADADLDFVYYQ